MPDFADDAAARTLACRYNQTLFFQMNSSPMPLVVIGFNPASALFHISDGRKRLLQLLPQIFRTRR